MNYNCVYTSGSVVCLNSSIYVIGGTINRVIFTGGFSCYMWKEILFCYIYFSI